MRRALLATALMNALGAVAFVPSFPLLRNLVGLPTTIHPLYLWVIAIWIGLFGCCYFWLSITGRSEQLFMALGAAGKLSFFLLFLGYWWNGELPLLAPIAVSGDLFFALLFVWWLHREATKGNGDRVSREP